MALVVLAPSTSRAGDGGDTAWVVAAGLIPLITLAFTIYSFYWIYARRGRLILATPRSFALAHAGNTFRLRLPLTFLNEGPKAYVIEDLRIQIPELRTDPFPWITNRRTVRPETGDVEDFRRPAAVPGRAAKELIAEFGDNSDEEPQFRVERQTYEVAIEARCAHDREWKRLHTFHVQVPPSADLGHYITYAN